jgi:hypothetical protein
VAFDVILNAVWLLLGTAAFAFMLTRAARGKASPLCCIGVGLIMAALFPIISATDDVIRIQHLERTHRPTKADSENKDHTRTSENLIRLYEAMELPLAVAPVKIAFTLVFAFLVTSLCNACARQRTVSQGGRSPPLALS